MCCEKHVYLFVTHTLPLVLWRTTHSIQQFLLNKTAYISILIVNIKDYHGFVIENGTMHLLSSRSYDVLS